MADRTFTQYDTARPLVAVLEDKNGPVDLSSALAVTFAMRGAGGTVVTGAMTPDADQTANKGKARHAWSDSETNVADSYKTSFRAHWSDGTYDSFPSDGYLTVEIQPALTVDPTP